MDGVSWSTSRSPESFKRPRTSTDTLSRLASFIARAESKQSVRSNKQQTSPFPCQECGESFLYANELLKHQEERHTLPKPHRCLSCGMEFSLRSSLQLHKCEESPPLDGEMCSGPAYATCLSTVSDVDRPTDGLSHCLPHTVDSTPYACAPCGKGFNHKQALLHHQQALCSETVSPPCMDNPCSPPLDSPPVFEEVSSPNSLDILGCSATIDSVCIVCSRTFRNEAAFQRHKQINHSDGKQTEPCCFFDKRESNVEESKASNAKSQKVFSCRSCEMVFSSTAKLYIHRKEKHSRGMKMRTDASPVGTKHRRGSTYTCQICSKVFFHHLSLWAHTRKHPASTSNTVKETYLTTKEAIKDLNSVEKPKTEKKHVPNKMSVQYTPWPRTAPPGKNQHKSQRSEEVPVVEEEEEVEFPCPSCPEVFSQLSELKMHVELHQSSVRRGTCSVCTNEIDSCKWPGSKKHRLYHCVPCQQGFSSLDSFLTHCQDHLRVKVEEEGLTEGSTRPAS